VEICRVEAGACTSAPVAVFTRGAGGGLTMDGSQYQADWKLGGNPADNAIGLPSTDDVGSGFWGTTTFRGRRAQPEPQQQLPHQVLDREDLHDCTQTFVGAEETTVTVPGEAQHQFPARDPDDEGDEFTVHDQRIHGTVRACRFRIRSTPGATTSR
jgi:hypothetical protein